MIDIASAISPIDSRYVGADKEVFAEVAPFLSGEAEIRYQIKVECAILEAYAQAGLFPKEQLKALEGLDRVITLEEVAAEEEKTQHNVRAMVNLIKKRLPPDIRPFVHLGPTSADVTDTAKALQVRDFCRHSFLPRLIKLERLLIDLARDHAATRQVGRTHGQHAVPTTFGHAMALYVSRLGGRIRAIESGSGKLLGKLAGAVGAYNSLSMIHPQDPRRFERDVMASLGLSTPPTGTSSQITEPEPLADLAWAAVSAFSVQANLADDLRHLMRSEIGEIKKKTGKHHVGSSTMPHKVNPKDFENVKSLWKALSPRLMTVVQDLISEHQRDLTNSASGRFLLELLAGIHYGTVRMERALLPMVVDEEAMARNLEASKEIFVAEPLYIVSGMNDVHNAYDVIKRTAEHARASKLTVAEWIRQNGWPEELASSMKPEHLKSLEAILETPESYIGVATQVATETASYWGEAMDQLEARLTPGTDAGCEETP